jgi:hypothetical protein
MDGNIDIDEDKWWWYGDKSKRLILIEDKLDDELNYGDKIIDWWRW